MTWVVRLAEAADFDAVSAMGRANHEESFPHRKWSDELAREAFFGAFLDRSEALIFVAEQAGQIWGFLLCGFYHYRVSSGIYAVQEVLFVRPEKRGTRAAALLMRKLIEISVSAGALEILGGNDNGIHSEQTARFLSRFGFRSYGHAMRLEIHG